MRAQRPRDNMRPFSFFGGGETLREGRELLRDVAFRLEEEAEASRLRRAKLLRSSLESALADVRRLEDEHGPLPAGLKEQLLRDAFGGAERFNPPRDSKSIGKAGTEKSPGLPPSEPSALEAHTP
jgi:hypothetical protein